MADSTNPQFNPFAIAAGGLNAITNAIGLGYDIKNADRNFEAQQAELQYQHELQERIFQREDTSYQRTVEDMKRAGLSPLAMSGLNGSGQVFTTSAPQQASVAQSFGSLGESFIKASEQVQAENRLVNETKQLSNESRMTSAQIDKMYDDTARAWRADERDQQRLDMEKAQLEPTLLNLQANLDKIKAETALTNKNESWIDAKNKKEIEAINKSIEVQIAQIAQYGVETALKQNDLDFLKNNGLSSYSPAFSFVMAELQTLPVEKTDAILKNVATILEHTFGDNSPISPEMIENIISNFASYAASASVSAGKGFVSGLFHKKDN